MNTQNSNKATLQFADSRWTGVHAGTTHSTKFLLCAGLASAVWLLLFAFGRNVAYGGDDSVVLVPLFHDGLAQSLGRFFRPLEYFSALLSYEAGMPLWVLISGLAFVGTAIGTWRLLTLVEQQPALWKLLVCVASPLAAQPYFQVDTVSQALANFFSLSFIIVSLRCFAAPSADDSRRYAWQMVLLASLCLLSKETTLGILFIGTILVVWRQQRNVIVPALGIMALLAAAVLFRVTYQYGVEVEAASSGLGLNFNPLYAAFNFVFSVIVALAPVPTSITLTGAFTLHPALTGIVALGVLVSLFGAFVYIGSVRLLPGLLRQLSLRIERVTVVHILLVYLMFSVVPTVFFKGAELYASQLVPVLKVLVLSVPVARPVLARTFWITCSGVWLLASIINLMSYSVATGYNANGRKLYAPVDVAVKSAPRVYSIYNRDIYSEDTYFDEQSGCILSRRSPDICLPKNIGSGFAQRR